MPETLTVAEAASDLAEYIDRVAEHGESFVLLRGNRPVAELRALSARKRLGELPALLASLPHLSPTEAGDFEDDLRAAREALASAEVHNTWKS